MFTGKLLQELYVCVCVCVWLCRHVGLSVDVCVHVCVFLCVCKFGHLTASMSADVYPCNKKVV